MQQQTIFFSNSRLGPFLKPSSEAKNSRSTPSELPAIAPHPKGQN